MLSSGSSTSPGFEEEEVRDIKEEVSSASEVGSSADASAPTWG
ncbi:hypothetical protein M7I_6968 [Glarea lozoyensis 74030]|uniref:Uncharacterized protein n=1 Tax=Glarea lozoyensis (strain ATCC 74030 / MF5533) TaxID=1104152 RepID=H0EW10_GLAL7|nr:hypothetical protein M7I_6968 [Glarea lozoyensis 74030]